MIILLLYYYYYSNIINNVTKYVFLLGIDEKIKPISFNLV